MLRRALGRSPTIATSTARLGLHRPTTSDPFSTTDLDDNYDRLDAKPGVHICTSTTRPSWGLSNDGMLILETDTGALRRWSWNGGVTPTWDVPNTATFAPKSLVSATVFKSGGAYPARPAGYAKVEWVGDTDPGALALTSDTWINNA